MRLYRECALGRHLPRHPSWHIIHRRFISNLKISWKVQEALNSKKPVVCLESTIITHGMEYPANLRMAKAVEKVIEDNGCVAATIAVLDGIACVGLEDEDLELLAKTGQRARKISRRDMAAAIADGATGGTTVSGTMILAKKAGIRIFVTGGIGGVHRGAQTTMDISNDLNELSRNDVAVVCAGPKAILDIPRTLEYLETMGVTVTTIGQMNLPAFYSRDSGLSSPQVSSSPEDVAKLIAANIQLGLGSSVLVCVPIPELASFDSIEMNSVILKAVREAEASGIEGKDTTPFLLAAVSKATQGRSLEANVALVLENARVGSQIAQQLAHIESQQKNASMANGTHLLDSDQAKTIADSLADLENGVSIDAVTKSYSKSNMWTKERLSIPEAPMPLSGRSIALSESSHANLTPLTDVLVVGGVAVDLTCIITSERSDIASLLHTSNPGHSRRSVGGVAGNIARALAISGSSVLLTSVVGKSQEKAASAAVDSDGQFVLNHFNGIQTNISSVPGHRTANYTCVQAKGELLVAVADMDIFNVSSLPCLTKIAGRHYRAIILDANIPTALSQLLEQGVSAEIFCFEPTSVPKSASLFQKAFSIEHNVWPRNTVNLSTPNLLELSAMFTAAQEAHLFESETWWELVNSFNITSRFRQQLEQFLRHQKGLRKDLLDTGTLQQAIHLLPYLENIYITMGKSGVLSLHLLKESAPERSNSVLMQEGTKCFLQIIYHPAMASPERIVNDTGAGDTFTGVLISALLKSKTIQESVHLAQKAAILTLASEESVSPQIDRILN